MAASPHDAARWTPARVRELRDRHGLTQAEMAPQLGYASALRVSELERDPRPVTLTAQTARLLDHIDRSGLLPPELVGARTEAEEGS